MIIVFWACVFLLMVTTFALGACMAVMSARSKAIIAILDLIEKAVPDKELGEVAELRAVNQRQLDHAMHMSLVWFAVWFVSAVAIGAMLQTGLVVV